MARPATSRWASTRVVRELPFTAIVFRRVSHGSSCPRTAMYGNTIQRLTLGMVFCLLREPADSGRARVRAQLEIRFQYGEHNEVVAEATAHSDRSAGVWVGENWPKHTVLVRQRQKVQEVLFECVSVSQISWHAAGAAGLSGRRTGSWPTPPQPAPKRLSHALAWRRTLAGAVPP
jgi:hypothetical protein